MSALRRPSKTIFGYETRRSLLLGLVILLVSNQQVLNPALAQVSVANAFSSEPSVSKSSTELSDPAKQADNNTDYEDHNSRPITSESNQTGDMRPIDVMFTPSTKANQDAVIPKSSLESGKVASLGQDVQPGRSARYARYIANQQSSGLPWVEANDSLKNQMLLRSSQTRGTESSEQQGPQLVSTMQPDSGSEAKRSDYLQKIDRLTKQIIVSELDFESLYTRYRIKGPEDPKWRYLRYTVFQQTAAGLTLASNIPYITESGANLGTPFDVSDSVIKRATRVGLIGIIFQGGSSLLELASNSLLYVQNKSRKADPASVLKDVRARMQVIDSLWNQRRELIEQHKDHPSYKAWVCEGRLLKTFRDWCVSEFVEVYADVRSYQSSANVYYGLDAISSGAYYGSYLLTIKGYKHEELFAASGITGIVGDSIGIISAPSSYASYGWLSKFWNWRVAKQLGEKPRECEEEAKQTVASLETELAGYEQSMKSTAQNNLFNRLKLYKAWADRNEFAEKRMLDYRHTSRVALQDEISGPLISSTFLAQDIMSTLAAYRFSEKNDNRLFFASSIPTAAATLGSIGLTTYWYVDAVRFEKKLQEQNASPVQLMETRLKLLNNLKESVEKP